MQPTAVSPEVWFAHQRTRLIDEFGASSKTVIFRIFATENYATDRGFFRGLVRALAHAINGKFWCIGKDLIFRMFAQENYATDRGFSRGLVRALAHAIDR